MNPDEYGPFANVVAIALALVATFSVLLMKSVGAVRRWTWIAGNLPHFMVTVGARALAVAIMAVTYVVIDDSNYGWFGLAAIVCGFLTFSLIAFFDRMRRRHVLVIPEIGPNGQHLRDKKRRPINRSLLIGSENNMNPAAQKRFNIERRKRGVSVKQFLGGYGDRVNDPEALWDRDLLSKIGNHLTIALMWIILTAVLALFFAALVIEVFSQTN